MNSCKDFAASLAVEHEILFRLFCLYFLVTLLSEVHYWSTALIVLQFCFPFQLFLFAQQFVTSHDTNNKIEAALPTTV